MFSNVPFSAAGHGQKGNHPSAQSSKDPLTLKVRASRILRAYIHAPSGQAAEGIFLALASLDPLPTFREAIQLTEKIPAVTQSRALTRFSALLEAQETVRVRLEISEGAKARKALFAHLDAPCSRDEREARIRGYAEAVPSPLVTPDRPRAFRDLFGVHASPQVADLAGRVEKALAILRGPGDPDVHIQAIGGVLFPDIHDDRERHRRASRFLLRAILSGATSEQPNPKDWSAAEPQPLDLDRFLDGEGGAT